MAHAARDIPLAGDVEIYGLSVGVLHVVMWTKWCTSARRRGKREREAKGTNRKKPMQDKKR
jgi:hypothetical protein